MAIVRLAGTLPLRHVFSLSIRVLLSLLLLCIGVSLAHATCSGSGTAFTCTAGSSSAQIQAAINSASANAVITFNNGTYTSVAVSLNGTNGITLICQSVGGCTWSGGDVISMDSIPSTIANLIRISGFSFTGNPSTAKIWFFGDNALTAVRIDHNTFSNYVTGSIAILFGTVSNIGVVYGVIDHNTFSGADNFMGVKNISGGENTTWLTGRAGTANNLFVENNTWTFTGNTDLGSGGIDVWRANGTVFRYNTMLNTRYVNHSYCHGGPTSVEIYENTISSPTGCSGTCPDYRGIHLQGSGETIAFNNVVGGTNNPHMALQDFRSESGTATTEGACANLCDGNHTGGAGTIANPTDGNRSPIGTYHGYPCWHQPGRDGAATLKPLYLWNNRNPGGTRSVLSLENASLNHIQANRDYYEMQSGAQTSATSPFNGTVGTGFGTLAFRPTTCTTGPEAADAGNGGVGYFATDVGAQGTLYRCSATNTWTVHYTPYTYPHPLVAGLSAAPTVTITAPTAGTTFSASSSPLTTLAGTASDDVAVSTVTWTNDRGGSGTATGTTSWSVSSIALQSGANVITVTATDGESQTGNDTLTVTLAASAPPTVTITAPTAGPTFTASTATLTTLAGTASDDVAVSNVTWACDVCGSGAATGTTSWSVASITLQPGINLITVTATDGDSQGATDTLTVTYIPSTIAVNTGVPRTSALSTGTAITTGPFGVAASSMLLVLATANQPSAGTAAVWTVTDNQGTHLTYTEIARRDSPEGSSRGAVIAWRAPVSALITGLTVSVTIGGGTNGDVSVKVYPVVNGDSVTPIGSQVEGSSTTNNLTTTALAPQTSGLGFAVASEWVEAGAPTSADLTFDGFDTPSSFIAGGAGVKPLLSGVSATANLDAFGAAAAEWNYLWFEVRAGSIGPPAPTILRVIR